MAEQTVEEILGYINSLKGASSNQPPPNIIMGKELEEEDQSVDDILNFINSQKPNTISDTNRTLDVARTVAEAEDDPKYIEYYSKRMLPILDDEELETPLLRSLESQELSDQYKAEADRKAGLTSVQKIKEEYNQIFQAFDEMSEEEKAEQAKQIKNSMLQLDEDGNPKYISGMQRAPGIIEHLLAETNPKKLFAVAKAVDLVSAFTDDKLTAGLELLEEYAPPLYNSINKTMAGSKYKESENPSELSGNILDGFGTFLEFSETLPVFGGLAAPRVAIQNVRRSGKKIIRDAKTLETARRYNPKGAELAALEAAEEARIAAKKVADKEVELSNQMIREFEAKTGKVISTESDGKLSIDPDLARQAGKDTAIGVTERDAGIQQLFLGTDTITSPILDPDKFDGIVAVAAELKQKRPDAFDNKKTVIDNILDLTVSQDMIGGQELIDMLNKYGLSFENYVLTVVGSGSAAGKVLNSLSQIKRKKPKNIVDADIEKAKARAAGDLRKGNMRIENVRRGGLVSQIATMARNLTSGGVRAPLESLGNVMDSAIYEFSQPISGGILDAKGGFLGAGRTLLSRDIWSGSFSNMKYMFSRPDVAKGYTDLILERPEMAKQFDAMFNNINEIQKLTGRGSGTAFDKVMTGMEDVVDTLNTPNRWQEFLIRRGQFFGELERLTKRHYKIDLIDALNQGKLKDLMNDSSSVKPKNAPSFIKLVDDATTKALDVTYAKQPDIPLFREISSIITRNGLTVIAPFPRFMFNSMELMGQYAAGASIPLTRKVTELVTLGKVGGGPLTAKDRQRITRNLMGMAAVGAAYWYRSSENVPEDFDEVGVGGNVQMNTTATYPMAQFQYLGEQTKRLKDGTFGRRFDAREFFELFTGSNFRVGVGNSILEEVAQIADMTDLKGGEAAGRAIGRTLGNYLTTWAVPLAQVIDLQRGTGFRGGEYADVAKDPTLDFLGTAGNELKRSFQQRGLFLSAEEEAELPEKVYPFYPDGKERVSPLYKFAGVTLTNRPSETGEYLKSLGFDYRQFGSKSKVPTIQRFEQQMLNGYMDILVDVAKQYEQTTLKDYYNGPQALRDEFTEEEYVTNEVRGLIDENLKVFKRDIREGAIAQGDEYARALIKYRRVQPNFRRIATQQFVRRYGFRPNPKETDHLQALIAIAKAYQGAL